MNWGAVAGSLQILSAHFFFFTFTIFLVAKLDHYLFYSWWVIFLPLWLFHAVVARGRFSLPAPLVPHGRYWAPCHSIVATPLLIAFELLLCMYLESLYVDNYAAVSLKIVFLPLLAFEITILIDNIRMCKALLPGDDHSMSDEAIWETLPHFWVAISMVFFVAATVFTLLKLIGDVGALGWWDLFINYGIAQCFAFLVCTKWSNPMIHRASDTREASSSSSAIRYLDWNSGLVVFPEEDQSQDTICDLPDIGGHIMKIPIVVFQVLLCMRLEGKPAGVRIIPLPLLFSPLLLLQGAGVLFAACRLVEKLVLLLRGGSGSGRYFIYSSRVQELFGFLHHGSRLLGWWSIHEGSREERSRLFQNGASGYDTFCGYPPEIVKKMPKKDLAEEVWRLQAALGKSSMQSLLRGGDQCSPHSMSPSHPLQRNKKVSRGVLGFATAIWVLFELLEYHLLTLVCHVLILALAVLFLWSNASTFINKSPPKFPEVILPEDIVLGVAGALRIEINRALAILRDIAAGKDLKKFLAIIAYMDASESSVSRPSKRAKRSTSTIWDNFDKVNVNGKKKAV